jgi:hypothetical protein
MSTKNSNDYLSAIKNMDEDFQVYMIFAFILIILAIFIGYMIYLSKLKGKECDYMNNLYSSLDGNIRPINLNDPDCSGNLYDYYIKTAYNSCSGGTYKNDFVDLCNLKAVLKQGVRCLDFEIYSVNDNPVVAASTVDNFHIKETFNSVDFGSVMDTIKNYAFSGSTCPNPTDPLIIHLRFMSNNQTMYSNLASIFKAYNSLMLGPSYSYEIFGKNLGNVPLLLLRNKIILIVDRSNPAFLENERLNEYVNLTSNSLFMREYNFYGVKNNPDINELTDFNRNNMTIVVPDSGSNPPNPSGIISRACGCQMVAMRYQLVDNNLMENALFFDQAGYAFALKPIDLRYQVVTVPPPTQQLPEYSYATRSSSTDYYSFSF